MSRYRVIILFGTLLLIVLLTVDIMTGATVISASQIWQTLTGRNQDPSLSTIIIDIRLIKAVTALLAGAALSVSGLEMQTLFRNPLAGPYVLGISSGASLGVAIFILGVPFLSLSSDILSFGIAGAAWIGAALILSVIIAISRRINDIMVILILGMMFSSATAAIVQILQYLTSQEALRSYIIWTMGSLGDVTMPQLGILLPATIVGLLLAFISAKQMNLLLLGEDYARTMGLSVRKTRVILILSTTLLAGTVTAFCGPIGFIGLAMPHISRMMLLSANHRRLIPVTIITGSCVMLFCDIISKILSLPINAITALIGIPIVIWIVIRHSR